jgi:hypothetical protein
MKKMKKCNNKAIRAAFESYKRSTARNLSDLYGRYSNEKAQALVRCIELCNEYGGADLRLFGANSHTFSAGFTADIDGAPAFVWITKSYIRYINI